MKIMGIDPGKKGGIVLLSEGETVPPSFSCAMPVNDLGIDVCRIQEILIEANPQIIYIEKQFVRSGQAGGFAIGRNYGFIESVIVLCGFPYREIYAQSWTSYIKKQMNKKGKYHKEVGLGFCSKKGFEVPTRSTRKNSPFNDGISDAFCIASYGKYYERIK
jgi:Holliday junction resolvasome RuvABC endonuclease subunit